MKKIISTLAILALTLGVNAQKTTTKPESGIKKESEQQQRKPGQVSPVERSKERKAEEQVPTETEQRKPGQVSPVERHKENEQRESGGTVTRTPRTPSTSGPVERQRQQTVEQHSSKDDKRMHAEEKSNGHAFSGQGKGGEKNLKDPQKKDKKGNNGQKPK